MLSKKESEGLKGRYSEELYRYNRIYRNWNRLYIIDKNRLHRWNRQNSVQHNRQNRYNRYNRQNRIDKIERIDRIDTIDRIGIIDRINSFLGYEFVNTIKLITYKDNKK